MWFFAFVFLRTTCKKRQKDINSLSELTNLESKKQTKLLLRKKEKMVKKILTLIVVLIAANLLLADTLMGQVFDSETNKPITAVSILFIAE